MSKETCSLCQGKGRLFLKEGPYGPVTRRCDCVLIEDIISNVDRGWPGLIKAARSPISESPLKEHLDKSLYVRSDLQVFKNHLRFVALRAGPDWNFKVVTDADLMVAWLANVSLSGADIVDPDIKRPSLTSLTLLDLVVPPELLIIRLGVKTARNVAMSEVFLEALMHREHEGLPTWIMDQPTKPLQEGHLCWSNEIQHYVAPWKKLNLQGDAPKIAHSAPFKSKPSFSFGMSQASQTKPVTLHDNRRKKK